MNYKETLDYLYSLQKTGIKLGLENTYNLLEILGNPQNKFKSIHIAGTNGKGSTSCFVASILSEMNFKVGLYTSPHLVRFNERIRIEEAEIEDDFIVEMTNFLKPEIEKIKATFFEVTTAIAFKYFAEKNVDFAVIETGLGGRLDATNVLLPQISVITKISYDHKEYLGDTIEKIAFEKAGIIKNNIPVIVSKNEEAVKNVFRATAGNKNSTAIFVDEHYDHTNFKQYLGKLSVNISSNITGSNYVIETPLIGLYQVENIKTAIATLEKLFGQQNQIKPIENGIRNLKFKLRGRFEVLKTENVIVLDTSHNADAINNFITNFNSLVKEKKIAVFGIMKDKEIDDVIELIQDSFDEIFICQAKVERALKAEELAKKFKSEKISSFSSVEEALKFVTNKFSKEYVIAVFGSNYIVGEAIEFLEKKMGKKH